MKILNRMISYNYHTEQVYEALMTSTLRPNYFSDPNGISPFIS